MDKNEAVSQFIANYPAIYSWIYFNVINMSPGDVSLITDSDNLINSFIDGTELRDYVFNIAFIKTYDTGTSDINMEAMKEAQNFNEWIKEQDKNAIYPDFGNDDVLSMSVLSPIPLMSIDTDASAARYMLQIGVSYLKRKDD